MNTEVKVIKSRVPADPYSDPYRVEKSDKSEQIDRESEASSGDWITERVDMRGLETLVHNSVILPQCIKAYRNNIAGFGLAVRYIGDIDETAESKKEWDMLERILDLLNLDTDTKEVFEDLIEARETYGIAYLECIRTIAGDVAEVNFVKDTPTVEMTYPLEPYVEIDYSYHGEKIKRKKKFRKFRQNIGGKTVYFKEFGDPRVMDKRDGEYLEKGETLDLDYQANEILDFPIGDQYYGLVRWAGTALTVDGSFRAEKLNNNYFRNGRHTPLVIIVRGGTLSDESYAKLQGYMDDIKGENGQHSFLILETELNKTNTAFTDEKPPEVELKDIASILQTDGLFQEYQENARKKVQSAFMLPDIYVGYTQDFNRSTVLMAVETTEKQVFQPERLSLAWQINNKLLNGYGFKYVEAYFDKPDITNPDDLQKLLAVASAAGGLTLNDARELALDAMGKEAEEYPGTFNMNDIGNVPLAVIKSMPGLSNFGYSGNSGNININDLFGLKNGVTVNSEENRGTSEGNKTDNGDEEPGSNEVDVDLDSSAGTSVEDQLEKQISKAIANHDDEIVSVMKEVRKLLIQMERGEDNE